MKKKSSIPLDAIELADDLRVVLRLLLRRLRHEDDGEPNSLSLTRRLLLSSIERNAGIGVAELARIEKVRGPTMSGHIKALEEAGLIKRSAPDPEDRRRYSLLLTEQGQAILDELRNRRRDWLAQRVAQLPPEGVTVLRQAVAYLDELGQ